MNSSLKIAVGGIYQTKFGELWSKSLADLIEEAICGCALDAGISFGDIQSVYIGNMLGGITASQEHLGALISQVMQSSVPITRVEAACASGGLAVRQAVMAIRSGEVENVLVIGAEKMTDLDSEAIANALMSAASNSEKQSGISFPGLYALLAQAYLHDFGATEKDLAKVAVKNHYHAQFNDKAHFPFVIDEEQVMKSHKVSHPLKMLDCSPISDGAAAVFIATPGWIQSHNTKNGVYITGSGQAQDTLDLSNRQSLTQLNATISAADKAYKQAGIEPGDVDCAEVHDCFTIAEILALEDLGFYTKGEGFEYIRRGSTQLGSKQPVNTSGGLKACGHPVGATGVKQIVEATLQLRHQAGSRQVEGARTVVTQNVGGTGGTSVVHVLTR